MNGNAKQMVFQMSGITKIMGIPNDCGSQVNGIPNKQNSKWMGIPNEQDPKWRGTLVLRNKLGEEKGAVSTSVNGVSVQIFIKTQQVVTFLLAVLPEEPSLSLSLAIVSLLWQWWAPSEGSGCDDEILVLSSALLRFSDHLYAIISILWSFSVCLTSSCFCT